jgi:hypothetical protein
MNATATMTKHIGKNKIEQKPERTVVVIHPSATRTNTERRAAVDQHEGKAVEKGKGKSGSSSQGKGSRPSRPQAYIAVEDPSQQVA